MSAVPSDNILAISPHLDDAVLSCGDFLSVCTNSTVVTVFAGTPPNHQVLTNWDKVSGFSSAGEAMQSRREEDRAALRILGSTPRWLDFLDSQYGATPSVAAIADALHTVLDEIAPAAVLYPSGLFHSDHVLVHEASLETCLSYPQVKWLMYEEASYRRIAGMLQQRLQALSGRNLQATPLPDISTPGQRKRDALQCYGSQLRALNSVVDSGYSDAFAVERYWTVEPCTPVEEQA